MPPIKILDIYFVLATTAKLALLLSGHDWKHAAAFLAASLLIYWHWHHFKHDQDMHWGPLFNGAYEGGANQAERRNMIGCLFAFHAVLLFVA
ncbi:hypothetical protein [Marilutibacter maris]|uniref:Uncharacterized protein n=1 Tax=Marilutibacter maris TaxID=1605891 RepID=A0A508B7S1_9GAMM|nr:hypothetical protein [Lysobacter maris]KAB8195614.1 hypothetical protein FKV24_004920 [Lysobacter maris]